MRYVSDGTQECEGVTTCEWRGVRVREGVVSECDGVRMGEWRGVRVRGVVSECDGVRMWEWRGVRVRGGVSVREIECGSDGEWEDERVIWGGVRTATEMIPWVSSKNFVIDLSSV